MFAASVDEKLSLAIVEQHHEAVLSALWQANRERLMRWEPWANEPGAFDGAGQWIRYCLNRFVDGTATYLFMVVDGVPVGTCGIMINKADASASIGYFIDEMAEGRGYVTKAAAWLMRHGFHEHNVDRIEIGADVDNVRSLAIPERLGFHVEGVVRGALKYPNGRRDRKVYSCLATDPEANLYSS